MFRLIKKWTDPAGLVRFEYEASFWEGPVVAGQSGRRVTKICSDVLIKGRPINTAPSVSYYGQLLKAIGGR